MYVFFSMLSYLPTYMSLTSIYTELLIVLFVT